MTKITITIITILVVIAVGGFFLFSNGKDDSRTTALDDLSGTEKEKFDKAPDFTLKNYDGNDVSLSDFNGKIRVVNSWAVWCPFCVDELPDFGRLQEEFGDEIVVIAIDRAESLKKTKKFTDELGITNKLILLLDPKDSFYRSIGAFSMPETLFIDKEGNIRIHKRGPMTFEEMKEKVESIINS